jgi:hypothetical protein
MSYKIVEKGLAHLQLVPPSELCRSEGLNIAVDLAIDVVQLSNKASYQDSRTRSVAWCGG